MIGAIRIYVSFNLEWWWPCFLLGQCKAQPLNFVRICFFFLFCFSALTDSPLHTTKSPSWPEWGHVQEWSTLTVWPADIMQHCTTNAEIFESSYKNIPLPVYPWPGRKHEHDINMHNTDTGLDKAPGQEAFCTVITIAFHSPNHLWVVNVHSLRERGGSKSGCQTKLYN